MFCRIVTKQTLFVAFVAFAVIMPSITLAFAPVPCLSKMLTTTQTRSSYVNRGPSSPSKLCMLASTTKAAEPDVMLLKLVRDLKDSDLRVIFDKFDADRSGSITESDWQAALKSLGLDSSKEYTSLWTHFDFNKDGSVDFADFQRSVDRLRNQYPKTNDENSATLEKWLERASRSPATAPIDSVLNTLIRKKVAPTM